MHSWQTTLIDRYRAMTADEHIEKAYERLVDTGKDSAHSAALRSEAVAHLLLADLKSR